MPHFVLSHYRYAPFQDPTSDDAPAELISHDPADSTDQLLVMLDAAGLIAPAAYDMLASDVIDQVNAGNGGEWFVTVFATSATVLPQDHVDDLVEEAMDAAGLGYHA